MQALVTVIIPSLNKKELLAEALLSLRAQTLKDFETMVIDNGSSDGTSAMVEKDFPEVTIIRNDHNRGFIAVNQGIKAAQTPLIALLNNDASADANWLKELVDGLKRHPDAWFASSKMVKADRTTIDSAGDGFNVNILAGYARGSGQKDAPEFNREDYCFSTSGGAAIYKKELFEKIGKLDEKFFAYFEDIDFGFRANLAGYKCIYLPKAVVYHRGGETSKHNSLFHLRLTDRNKMMTLIKNLPVKYFWQYKHAAFDIFFWPLFELKQGPRMVVFFWSRLQVLFWLPLLLSERLKIARSRKITDRELEKILT